MIDVPDLDAALSWAARCPGAATRHDRGAADLADAAHECRMTACGARGRRDGRAPQLRQAGRVSRRRARATSRPPRTRWRMRSRRRSPTGRRAAFPHSPEAWLLSVARRKSIDAARRRRTALDGEDQVRLTAQELEDAAMNASDIPDQRLALMFACAHPAIDAERARAADPADRARLRRRDDRVGVSGRARHDGPAPRRAPRRRSARPAFRSACRSAPICAERLDAVLAAIYAAFAEGWSDPAGTQTRRRNLSEEGIWLGRLVASLLPDEPEALGLLALMLHAEARRARAPRSTANTCRSPSRIRPRGTRR